LESKRNGWQDDQWQPIKPAKTSSDLASAVGAIPIGRNDAVNGPEHRFDARQFRENEKGPSPPDSPRNFQDGIGASRSVAVCKEHAHFGGRLFVGQAESSAHPGSLKWGKGKTVPV